MSRAPFNTRQRLIDAARAEFEAKGWEGARDQAILERAQLSTGSWRHFFPDGQVGVAAVIYEQIFAEVWDGVLAHFVVPPRGRPVELIEQAYSELLVRITEDRGRARLLFQLETALTQTAAADVIYQSTHRARRTLDEWASAVIAARQPVPPPALAWGLIIGPILELCREWALGHVEELPAEAVSHMAQAAVNGVLRVNRPGAKGKPGRDALTPAEQPALFPNA